MKLIPQKATNQLQRILKNTSNKRLKSALINLISIGCLRHFFWRSALRDVIKFIEGIGRELRVM
jgi:hypothetical protein